MKQMILLYLLLVSASLFAACSGGSTAAKLDANSMSIDTMGLPYSWQANRVEATAYDNSQPPGAMGLPEHIQVNFGVTDPADVQFGDPILYIIPVEEYKQLWDEAGNTAVSNNLNNLESILKDKPDLNTASLSALPYEAYVSIGAGNLAVTPQKEYLDTPWGSAVRYVARPMQGVDVILNYGVAYIAQGLTDDGKYLVSFFYPPLSTSALSNSVEEISEAEFQQANNEWATYRQEKEDMLNELSPSDWDPDLTTLDAVIGSLQFGGYGG
ncbi:MAG: hypothetical protein GWP61_03350 [Chloroflexi bacterium]|jgi:hypothetical protein|nr:hypothetical protein [Chloroflexota bacterium]